MDEGIVIYYGQGKGKSSAALGFAVRCADEGKIAYIVRFLKSQVSPGFLEKLEPECKLFRFERSASGYNDRSEQEKLEEQKNIKNGLAFAKKALTTGECDLLVLDEVLGAIEEGIITSEELTAVLSARSPSSKVIMTGNNLPDSVADVADRIYNIVIDK